ncbi:MAG: ATP-binding cassette domain-containing protein [Dehalococcoidia bacterium]|nr:MAG: ATP-binding cassette domain-containing protein [Dehalococcoidia bacterium]
MRANKIFECRKRANTRKGKEVPSTIVASELTRYYGDLLAVDHVNFEVQQGEIFGYLGPNGAGKTTTIKMLTGLLRPTKGTADVEGHDILHDLREVKRSIGIVPEVSNVYDELTAWDNLIFAAELYSVPRGERGRRAEEYLGMFDLYERRLMKVEGFSKGMKRRLTIAMALVHRPSILFLDEPTTGLDARSAVFVRDLIRRLKDKGTTIFLTTHYIEEADQLCDRVAIINEGRIVANDAPERLKSLVLGVHTIEVSFDGMNRETGHNLEAIPGCDTVVKQGDKFKLYTQEPSQVLPRLMGYAEERALTVISLNTLKPSLEDVFLKMTAPVGEREE